VSHRRRPAPRRTLTTSLALASIGLGACAISDLASFLGDPFGDISDEVRDLDEGQLESMMGELMLRFRSYLALRDAVPFADIAPDACVLASSDDGVAFTVEADVGCIFGGRVSPASGTLIVTQEQLATNPVPVFRFDLTYVDVIVGDVSVSGTEKITETDDTDGASVRKIDLVQNGRALASPTRARCRSSTTRCPAPTATSSRASPTRAHRAASSRSSSPASTASSTARSATASGPPSACRAEHATTVSYLGSPTDLCQCPQGAGTSAAPSSELARKRMRRPRTAASK
jgi:hypothetical protein